MLDKKILGILIISLFVVASVPVASAEFPNLDQLFTNDDSVIDLIDIYMFVAPNGLLHMNETYYFTIQDNNKVFTRDIPIAEYQSVKNINVTGGNNNTFVNYEVTEKGHNKHVVVTVYGDKNLTTNPEIGTPVAVTINYDYLYLTEFYKDTGVVDLSFSWNRPVDQLVIHSIYNSTDVEYWLQPGYVQHTDSWNGTILSVATGRLSAGENIEFVSTIPHDYFDTHPIYAHIIKTDGLNSVRLDQKADMGSLNIINYIFIILPIILFISLIIPFYIYYKYSRRTKVEYDKKYESQIPSNMMPMFVNSIFKKGRTVGEPTNEGFEATILSLLNKGYFKLGEQSNVLKINSLTNIKTLLPFEEDIISLFSNFEENGTIDLNKVKTSLKDENELKFFKIKYNKILLLYKENYIRSRLDKMFSSSGAYKLRLYAVIIILISLFLLYFSFKSFLSFAPLARITSISFIIFALVLIFLPDRYGGHWTSEGKLEYLKWQKFRKFYKKENLINENMPSLDKWDDMIVYAHALGDKNKILKVMEKTDINSYNESNLVNFLINGGYDDLKEVFKITTASRLSKIGKK